MPQAAIPYVSDFLIAALSGRNGPGDDLDRMDWDAAWAEARNHCIAPYLHRQWSDSGSIGALPQGFADRLARARARNSVRNRRLAEALKEIDRSLEGDGIPLLVSKGLTVAQEFYGDLGLRVLYDLDLIVHSSHRSQAEGALGRLGYRPYFTNRNAPKEGQLFWRPQAYRWTPESVFDPDQPVFVELHTLPWKRRWHGFGVECRLDLWDRHRNVEISGIALRVPAVEKLLVHLAVHYAFNVLESSARLMHLLDIVLLLRRNGGELDWERVWYEIVNSRVAPLCCIPFMLSERIGGPGIPDWFRHRVEDATPPAIGDWLRSRALRDVTRVNVHNRDHALIYFLHWHAAATWSEKLRVLGHSCRAPFADAAGGLSGWGILARRMAHRVRNLAQAATTSTGS